MSVIASRIVDNSIAGSTVFVGVFQTDGKRKYQSSTLLFYFEMGLYCGKLYHVTMSLLVPIMPWRTKCSILSGRVRIIPHIFTNRILCLPILMNENDDDVIMMMIMMMIMVRLSSSSAAATLLECIITSKLLFGKWNHNKLNNLQHRWRCIAMLIDLCPVLMCTESESMCHYIVSTN